MATPPAGSFLRQLRRLALRPHDAALTDGQLLRSFLNRRDEAAFEALVRRHGPMVRGVCRRVLRNVHDADDAFQAVFLVLLRKAPALATREVVGDWLHGVAYRTALKARAAEARRRVKERQTPRREAIKEESWPEWRTLLDQEVGRLPEKYRLPVVLCDLQGRTRNEAARQLGWPEGTLSGRLARARTMLARRLTRRGMTLPAGALSVVLTREAAAHLPISLVDSTCKAAMSFAAGHAAAVPATVAALTEGVVRAMFLSKLKTLSVLLASALVLAAGVGAWRHTAAAGQTEERREEKPLPVPRDRPKVPGIVPAVRHFQIDLRLLREKDGQRKLLASPRLLAREGKQASFATGEPYSIQVGREKYEEVVMGPAVQVLVRSEEGRRVRLDMTMSQPIRGLFDADVTVETKSVRVLRSLELGEPVAVKLKTGDKDQNVLEVTAAIREVEKDTDANTIAAAENDLKMAEFYRRSGHLDSSRFYYELIRRRYPDTIYAERARERLAELKEQPEKPAEAQGKEPPRVGQIFVRGNAKTPQDVILKRFPLFPGQVLIASDLRDAERNLSRLKGLKSAKVGVMSGQEDSVFKDIEIIVEEK